MSDSYQTLLENNKLLMESNVMLNTKIIDLLKNAKILNNRIQEMNIINENYREIQIDYISQIQKYIKINTKLEAKVEIMAKTISENNGMNNNKINLPFQGINIIPFPFHYNTPYLGNNNNPQNYINNNTIQPNTNNLENSNSNFPDKKIISNKLPPPLPVTPLPTFPGYKKKNKSNEGKKKISKNSSGNITLELKYALQNQKDSSASNILKNIKKMRKNKKNNK